MRCPFLALVDPGGDDRKRADDEEWALVTRRIRLIGGEVGEEGEGLKRFSETHFIAKNTRGAVVIEPEEEGEAGKLVALHNCSYSILELV